MPRRRKRRKRSKPSQVAHEACNHEEVDEGNDSLQGDIKHRSFDEDTGHGPILEPKHKIFLSHSGTQKLIVEVLCELLEARFHHPFYDRRHHSLPMGERFPELIVQAAKQCKMLIVVVSDEYFMSKWPMIELNAFVRAHKLSRESNRLDGGPKILPLFYGLSVSDLADKAMREKWFHKWETFAKADPKKRIVVNDWKSALDILGSFNGVVYDRESNKEMAFIREIVSVVCKSIVPDIKRDDSHVQGKSSIYKVIHEKMERVGYSEKYQVKVVGIYGVGGIGKTMTCKTLCDELSNKYEGRVCHIEFQSEASKDSQELLEKYYKELLQKVLVALSRNSKEAIQQLNEGQCKHILYESLSKQRIFLAIDNVWDDLELREQAKMYLDAPYHKDSLVMVTSRSKCVLERLGIDGDACLEMPELGEDDAVKLFLHHAAGGKQDFGVEDGQCILRCVGRCYFSKGDGKGHHYHPLALKVLGLLMSCHGGNPREWVDHLPRVRTFSDLSKKNPVFDILRSSFDVLPLSLQTLFMDVGVFVCEFAYRKSSICGWLCDVHKQNEADIKYQLDCLKRRGLLQDVDLSSGEVSMHDLYGEFVELELRGKLKESTDMAEWRWIYVNYGDITELEKNPGGGWHNLTRLAIKSGCQDEWDSFDIDRMECVKGIKLNCFSNVEVLLLNDFFNDFDWKWGALNLEPMVGLRSLTVCGGRKLERIEGLEGLKNLTRFEWLRHADWGERGGSPIVGQLPLSLKSLEISGNWGVVESNLLTRCRNLSKLKLSWVKADILDVKNCWSLDSVILEYVLKCQALVGLGADRPSCLQYLQVSGCDDLVDIPGIDRLTKLRELRVRGCCKLKVPSLLTRTEWQALELCGEPTLVLAMDCIPVQLRVLEYRGKGAIEDVNLDGFNQLEVLQLNMIYDELQYLEGMGDFPALRRLDLSGCGSLLRLPDLSQSRNLEELILYGCFSLELHERDIEMLSELPLLRPVLCSGWTRKCKVRLNLVRRKVLIYSCSGGKYSKASSWKLWKEYDWEERFLGAPPIQIREFCYCRI